MNSDLGTALVTGASSGVGVDFARELARRGFDLILTARRRERLEQVRDELRAEFPVQVELLTSDLAPPDGARRLYDDVQQAGHRVTLLVNNAGLGHFGPFVEQSLDDLETTIRVNVQALTTLTRLFAADMHARGGGYILNNGSFSAIQPTPHYAVYSGTKAYVLAFSQALRHQLRPHGVRISVLLPGFFDSEFMERSGQQPSWIVRFITLRSAAVARAGIAGTLRGKPIIIPGLLYKSLNLLVRLLPRTVATAIADLSVRH
jgi:short-subunit dehydrogenase